MKIGVNYHTYDNFISGVDYYTLGMLNGLLSIDHTNEYVVYTNRPQLFEQHLKVFNNLSIYAVNRVKSRMMRICWEHLILPWVARRDKLDVLHCPVYITPCIKVGIPYVVTIHDTFALDNPQWCKRLNRLNFGFFMPNTSFKADSILTVSQQTRQALLEHSRMMNPIVIYPGIDEDFVSYGNAEEDYRIKAKYCLPDRYLLYVGNVEPKKNIETLLKAYKIMKSKKISYPLVLVGKRTWLQTNIWDYIQEHFSKKEIILVGYAERKELPSIYRQAEVFMFPSLAEGFGFPAIEAMRCGVPVVASSVGILKELPGEAYCLIDPNDPMDIALKTCSMLEDSAQKIRQIELAQRISQRFTWERCAQKILKIYQQLVA